MSQRYIGGLIYNPPGGFSGYFDGSDDLNAPSNAAFTYGTSDFTVEGWFFITGRSGPNDYEYLFAQGATTGSSSLGIYRQGGVLKVWNGSTVITGTTTLALNTWNHIALSRSGTTMRLFLNGVQEGSATNSNSISTGTSYGISVGRWTEVDTNYIIGYVSNFRVVKGTAVYTAAFTPPNGPLQAITNTSLLTCAYGTFRDGSTNNFTITVNGNTAVSTQNPFPLTTLPNPALGNQGNGIYSMSQYQSLLQQNLWPGVDPYFENVTLLLHGNGTNGAQNNTFLDSSTNNFTITRNGNTTQGTFTPYGDNWSNYFDGTGDYLTVADNAALQMASGDFTIEFWINFSSITGYQTPFDKGYTNAGGLLFQTGNGNGRLIVYAAGSAVITETGTGATGTWIHYALVRSGTTLTLYRDGVSTGSATNSTNFNNANQVGLGATGTAPGGGFIGQYAVNGYMSNVRVVKGTAVYTSNFTPSTAPLTAITNTSLLTCQSNRFIDNSSNNFTITRNGDVSVQRFSPFNPTAPYAAGTIGGSGYFDGSGDYLTVANSSNYALGTDNFTIELWVYPTATFGSGLTLFSHGYVSYCPWLMYTGSSGALVGYASSTGSSWDILSASSFGTLVTGAWNHIALCRSGNTFYLCMNGVVTSTATSSAALMSIAAGLTIGATTSGIGVIGSSYITNARIIKGTALYTSSYTLPTAPITAVSGTQFLLSATNGGIIDNAMMNDLETVGNAQISTSVSKFGGGSMAFDGSGDYLTLANVLNTNLGSGPFTIELWAYFNSASGTQFILSNYQNSTIGYGLGLSSGVISFWATGDTPDISSGLTPSTGVWYHIAVSGQSGSIKLFINGTQYGSTFTGTPALDSTATLRIGDGQGAASPQAFNGYIDDLRITKGYARYTANFTPQRSQWQDQ